MKLKLKNKEVKRLALSYAKSIVMIPDGKKPSGAYKNAIVSVASDYTSGYMQGMKDAQIQIDNQKQQ